ncbi:MAG: S-formylglutathione hydrolase [Pseudomonadales bacterium]|jgi:S-formylglutathione hydrolase|nr:S-formylglutathione hydrolase [Pseudomonadales bacterium]
MSLEQVSANTMFGGKQIKFKHHSKTLKCDMAFSVYLPPSAKAGSKVPVIYWLSGLTCTDDNFVQKAGAQQYAADAGVAIVCLDTSPRGEGVPDDANKAYDFGLGAGFYVNATEAPWSTHYHMYDYVTQELPDVLAQSTLPLDTANCSIMGHSMGGHGALTIALKNPGMYKAVSAFSPICSPLNCPWGHKALGNYIGQDKKTWEEYDTCALIPQAKEKLHILVDQGQDDQFLVEQLKPELLQAACQAAKHPLTLRLHSGYDHSYFFIASFIADHIAHHAEALWG